jgi:hypothetical protein
MDKFNCIPFLRAHIRNHHVVLGSIGPDPHGWVLSLKEMEASVKKMMDRYVIVTATLYREIDELSVIIWKVD